MAGSDNTLEMAPTQVAQMPGPVKYRWWQRPSDGVIFEMHVAEHVLRLIREGWREVDGPGGSTVSTPAATVTPEAAVRYRYFSQPHGGNLVVETASVERATQLLAAGWSEMDAPVPAESEPPSVTPRGSKRA